VGSTAFPLFLSAENFLLSTFPKRRPEPLMFNARIKEKEQPYKVITQSLLEETIAHQSPSVTSRQLKEFERVRSEFSPKDKGRQHVAIGFH
jgi:hypothetical protein